MRSYRTTAMVVGILFIVATAFLFVADAVVEPILTAPDVLDLAYPQRTRVVVGVLLDFTTVLAMALIPVVLFPVLRKFSAAMATGYIVFRSLEAVLTTMADINDLTLIRISQNALRGDGTDAVVFQSMVDALRAENDAGFILYVLFFVVGTFMLNSVLYRSRLVPRWLSIWGIVGAAAILLADLLGAFGLSAPTTFAILVLPIAVQEMALAGWLIAKGFDRDAIASVTGATRPRPSSNRIPG